MLKEGYRRPSFNIKIFLATHLGQMGSFEHYSACVIKQKSLS